MERLFSAVEWSYTTNLYEVNIRQYTPEGTFEAFSAHLPRLRDMGVEVLWFMPITPISHLKRQGALGSYYACSDYVSINPEFGTIEDFVSLVKKCHGLGFKVIIDWVANHTGCDHKWTVSNPEYYKRNAAGEFYDTNGWNDVIDLNYYDHAMRREMIASMEFWIRRADIDGFRCDMAHLVPLDFWKQARQHLDSIKKLFWLAETEDAFYFDAFDCNYGWNWMHRTEDFAKHKIDLPHLLDSHMKNLARFPTGSMQLYFTSNHDENSWNGSEYEKYGEMAQALAIFSVTWPGLPLVYSGQELPNYKRLKFFDKDQIDWNGQFLHHDFYKRLFDLRRTNPCLNAQLTISSNTILDTGNNQQILSYLRAASDRKLFVLLNLSKSKAEGHLKSENSNHTYRNILTGKNITLPGDGKFELDPGGYLLLEQ